ncbi:MAG: P1 family peptidase [Desulfomonilaceae bacterium]
MKKTGPLNCITDVPGVMVGHYTDEQASSGVTVVLCLPGAVCSVDVRGSAPGTRETDLLDPVNLVDKVQGIVLSGGSVYGLSAADGVVTWLAEKGHGFELTDDHVAPIVPAAALFDLGRGCDYVPAIGPEWGFRACESAARGAIALGCVGAGTGAVSGGIKGGVGAASELLPSGVMVGVLIAVNSLGSAINPATGALWEAQLEIDSEFGPLAHRRVRLPASELSISPSNTTIGVVAVSAALTKAQCRKVAQMAQDGLARAIRPAHTMFDGDAIFCISTGDERLSPAKGFFPVPKAMALNEIGASTADCVARAIIRAILKAHSMGNILAFRDLEAL